MTTVEAAPVTMTSYHLVSGIISTPRGNKRTTMIDPKEARLKSFIKGIQIIKAPSVTKG